MRRHHLPPSELKNLWYQKLKDSGFEDIENSEYSLKRWDSYVLRVRHGSQNNCPLVYHAKIEYFRMAGFFLHDYVFPTEIERFIWKHHADGKYIEEIAQIIARDDQILKKLKKSQLSIYLIKLRRQMYQFYNNREDEDNE